MEELNSTMDEYKAKVLEALICLFVQIAGAARWSGPDIPEARSRESWCAPVSELTINGIQLQLLAAGISEDAYQELLDLLSGSIAFSAQSAYVCFRRVSGELGFPCQVAQETFRLVMLPPPGSEQPAAPASDAPDIIPFSSEN